MFNITNNISFKGMDVSQIKKFAPTIANKNATNLSRLLEMKIPNDVLAVANKNEIHHLRKIGKEYTIMGIFKYNGPDEELSRVNFISKVASKVAEGLGYKD